MHIQPHSKAIRSPLSSEEHFALSQQEKRRSFIGLNLKHIAREMIHHRLDELAVMEQRGFVYLGEKNWLLSFQAESEKNFDTYDLWVHHNFETFLELNFQLDENYEYGRPEQKIWKAEKDMSAFLWKDEKIKSPLFEEIDELEIYVSGNEREPSSIHLVQAFEFLHNLEHCLLTFPENKSWKSPLGITGIEVCNLVETSHWELNVVSEYGSAWDESIIGGWAWRRKP